MEIIHAAEMRRPSTGIQDPKGSYATCLEFSQTCGTKLSSAKSANVEDHFEDETEQISAYKSRALNVAQGLGYNSNGNPDVINFFRF